MSNLWVHHALNMLGNAKGEVHQSAATIDLDPLIDSCQVQVVHAYRMPWLKNVPGGEAAYRSACESALHALKGAKAVPIPFLGLEPAADDHPRVRDQWQRERQRREQAVGVRLEHLAKAMGFLKQAAAVADEAHGLNEAARPKAPKAQAPQTATTK